MTLAIFSGLPYKDWYTASLLNTDIERIIDSLSWIENFPLLKKYPLPEKYHVGGKVIKVPQRIELETLGQRIAFEDLIIKSISLTGDILDVLDKAVAIYLYPKMTGKVFDTDKLDDVLDKVRNSSIAEAYPMGAFFLQKYLSSSQTKAPLSSVPQSPKRSKPTSKRLPSSRS